MYLADSSIQGDVLTRAPAPSLEAAAGAWRLPACAPAIDHNITQAPLHYYNTGGFNYSLSYVPYYMLYDPEKICVSVLRAVRAM